MTAAKKKVITNAINPLNSISYLMMTTHVPMKQMAVHASIEQEITGEIHLLQNNLVSIFISLSPY